MNHLVTGPSDLLEAKAHIDSLKNSFASTWHGTERTLEFFMQLIQRQSQYIGSLQEKTNILDRQNEEKSDRIRTLELKLTELESFAAERQRLLIEVTNDNHKLKVGLARGLSRFQELQNRMRGMEANHQGAVAEVASLRIKLIEAEERALSTAAISAQGIQQSSVLTDEQWKILEDALKRELEVRNGVVRKAAQDAIEPLRTAYAASQARVGELEEELQKHRGDTIMAETLLTRPDTQDEGPSSNASGSHIFSGNYRPGTSPTLEGQNGNVTVAPSLPNQPPSATPLVFQAINSSSSSSTTSHEVIDLTESPDDFPKPQENERSHIEGDAQRRAGSNNAMPSQSNVGTIHSKAHKPTQGSTNQYRSW